MDTAIRLKKGKVGITVNQCDSRGRISFVQDVPFPVEILSIVGRVALGDEARFEILADPLPDFLAACREELAVTDQVVAGADDVFAGADNVIAVG